jgi:trans-AT polyketide synthase, acyltransferase and oxidoreductase domains
MKYIFMFSGQGSQYYHMGSGLFNTDSAYRQQMYQLDEIVQSILGLSVIEELYNPQKKLSDPFLSLKLTHPAIFMTGYALVKELELLGIVPDYLLGCSLGEFIAATVSGILDKEDAIRLIIQQAGAIENNCSGGKLLAVLDDPAVYHSNPVVRDNSAISGIYAPSQFVIAGETSQIDLVKNFMKGKDILHQELMVSYGFHSPAVDPAERAYKSCLKDQVFRLPGIPLVSGVSGERLSKLPEYYFWDIVRKPISYSKAITTIENTVGNKEDLIYIDIGPAGSLANLIKYNIREGSTSRGFQIMTPFRQEIKKIEELKKYHQEHKKKPVAQVPLKKERLLAYIFPGQGSQKRGMGEDLFPIFPDLTDIASEILGYSVKELCLQDPNRQLNMTQYTQPALYVVNALSYLRLNEENGTLPDFVAGHSLGEYDALFAAGAMDFETGLRLVQKRGALMARMKEGGMAAIKGLNTEEIRFVIQRHGLEELDMANYNTQNQVVLSGPRELIARSAPHFLEAGASLYFPLNVSGAFHSRYMMPARDEFEQFLRPFNFSPLNIPVVSNVDACFYPEDGVQTLLTDQLVKPVRWAESILFLLEQGELDFKEVGPGDVLTKMVYGIQRDFTEIPQLK